MFDLAFITSNLIKVANVAHLCREYSVNVFQYKQLYYGVSYEEPRILDDRKELLDSSFSDAVERWIKNGNKRKYFFLEDTSVRIDALSTEDKEVPGIDIKYWMQEHNFEELDSMLKAAGNNRKASVSSHILLYIPEEERSKYNINGDRVLFTSSSHGRIVEKQYDITTQIAFPWLDNKTFNKWFIPEGFNKPISLLDINDADTVDFRRDAVHKMLRFLGIKEKKKNSASSETSLSIPFEPSYIVCGETCSGKTTLGRYLVDKYGYYHIEASQFMTMRYWENHGTSSDVDKHMFAEGVLQTEPYYVVDKTLEFIRKKGINNRIVITGFRSPDEVKRFMELSTIRDIRVVFLESDYDERFIRWVKRQRDQEKYNKQRFDEINTIQKKMGVLAIRDIPEVLNIKNNIDGLSEFYKTIRSNLLKGKYIEVNRYKVGINPTTKVTLENCILYALYVVYIEDENNYKTTTEISHIINKCFPALLKPKNKNNVSRYFNQKYYPYYEVKNINGTNKFQLSTIGYAEARLITKKLQQD